MRGYLKTILGFIFVFVLMVLLYPGVIDVKADYTDDNLKPIGAGSNGTTSAVTWNSQNSEYIFQHTDGNDTINYTLPMTNANVTNGLIVVKAELNNNDPIYPVYWGGARYRDSSGTLMEPYQLATSASSVDIDHSLSDNIVTVTVTDTYQSVARTKTYTYKIEGKTLIVGVGSTSTAYYNNYAGLQLDRSYSTTNASIKEIAYADDNPSVMVDDSFFYSTVVDRCTSNSVSVSFSSDYCNENSVWCSITTLYEKNTAGNVNPLNEVFYITVSNDVMDTVYKTSKTASAYRNTLSDLVVLDLWAEGSGYGDDDKTMKGMDLTSRKKRVAHLYDDWKMDKVLVVDHQWQRYSYDQNFPVSYPANPQCGTGTEFASWVSTVKNTYGYKIALHEDYWFMCPTDTNKYWNTTGQSFVAKDADGNYRNGWYSADSGIMSYAIRAEKMKYYSDLESTQINTNYDPNIAYLDVNGAWTPDMLNQVTLDANASDSKTLKDAIIGNKTLFDSIRAIYNGPLMSEGGYNERRFDSSYAGYVDSIERKITDGMDADIIVDYEVKHLRPLMANFGMGNNIFGSESADTADWDKYRSMLIAFNHMGSMNSIAYKRPDLWGKEYYMIQALQTQYLNTSVSVNTIEYWNGSAYKSVSEALKDGYDFKESMVHIVYSNGLNIYVNFNDSNWTVTYNSVSYTIPQNGWVAGNSGSSFLEYSCLKNDNRVDYVDCSSYTYADGRGNSTNFGSFTTKGQKLIKKGTGDSTAPGISNIKVGHLTDTTAVVTWTTNESSSSIVEYGATTGYGSKEISPLDFIKDHSVILTGLTADTTYHFRVRSEDIADNGTNSADFVLKTRPSANKASTQFSSTQGSNNWYYQYWNGSAYSNMTWDGANSVWKHSTDTYCSIGSSYQHPGTANDSVRKWVASSSGWYQVTGELYKSSFENPWDTTIEDDGLRAYISLNDDVIWYKEIESQDSSKIRYDLTLYLNANDVLYFRENRISLLSCDGLGWDPLIIPLSKSSFTASTDFASDNGTYGWYYRSWDGTQYKDMTYSGSSWSESSAYIYNNHMIPSSTRDASRLWIASASGDIKITGNAKKRVTGGDGVIIDIFLNSQSVWKKTIAANDTTGYNHSVVIHVETGDLVEFRVNRNSTSTSDDTTWDPTIEYFKPYYSVDDFGSTQGGNQWYYQKWNGSTYSNLTWNSGLGKWELEGTYLGITSTDSHPESSYDAVRKWVAPNDGKIKVYGIIQRPTSGGDGIVANVLLNSTEYWSLTIAGDDTTTKSFSLGITVHEGDAIYFRLNKNSTLANDSTTWKAKIEYCEEKFNASDEFSSTQGLNCWYYQRLNTGNYYDLSWDSENNYWKYPTYCIVSATDQHPESSNDAVRKWVAPFKGTIRIKGSSKIYNSGGDGVTVTIKQGSTTKWSRFISGERVFYLPEGAFVYDLTLDVDANDNIYFILNKNSTISNDSTLLDPEITYTQKF